MTSGGKNFIDLTGMVFNKLTVIRLAEKKNGKAFWWCKCACGNEKEIKVSTDVLKKGSTKSCGCARIKDILGKKFGKLLVKEYLYTKDNNAYWICDCDCGNENIIVKSSSLSFVNKKSCGCLTKEVNHEKFALEFGESSFNSLYYEYIKMAKKRNINFELTKEYFREIVNKNCYYCGIEPKQNFKSNKNAYGHYVYNGVDRLNSDKNIGYIPENVVPCCGNCNKAKMDMSEENFKELVTNIYNYWILKKS